MKMAHLSIKTTLLLIIGLLSFLIAAQAATGVYKSWQNYIEEKNLQQAATVINQMFAVEKYLSHERGATTALLNTVKDSSGSMMKDIRSSRAAADAGLQTGLDDMRRRDASLQDPVSRVNADYAALKLLRATCDVALRDPAHTDGAVLSDRFFDASTKLIEDIHTLVEDYSRPFLSLNPAAARQMRFSHVLWVITEYAGREYALLGKLVARNQFPTAAEREKLLLWQGRIQYGWELAHSASSGGTWTEDMSPVMQEAETHYFMTFEQIKGIFSRDGQDSGRPAYPISVAMWIELASQAVDSLAVMNDDILQANTRFVNDLKRASEQHIILSLLLFTSALLLTFYSWQVIMSRVVQPVNAMITALDKATRGEYHDFPQIYPENDEIGKLANVLGAFRENARQLQQERDKAEAAIVAKSEFLANMSHEIRTPMNVVLGLSNILARSEPLTPKQQEFVKTLHLSAESLLSIINDLLDFSKLESQNVELEKIPFSLARLIGEIMTLLSVRMQEKSLTTTVDIDAIRDREYIGDPARIRQALMNVCSNAVKFTEQGGITVKARRAAAGPAQDKIEITIADTGIGIAPEKQELIFDKFTQADSSISRRYGGTGLGLAIARTFIEMMGGTITVSSTLKKGTVFTIRLQLAVQVGQQGQAPQNRAPAAFEEHMGDATVLLVEDYAPNALVAAEFLKMFGFDCDIAENGVAALEKIDRKKYHAILMDIQMPELDGYQTTREIRRREKKAGRPPVRIIGMTAHAMPTDKQKCLDAGMDDYISKPFDAEDLRQKLSS